MPRRRNGHRFVAAAAAGLLAVGMVTVAAAPAQATGNQRTFTASLTPDSIPAQEATQMSLRVTNTSRSISFLDRVRVTVPTGFEVEGTGITVSAPRGGWSGSLSGDTLTARTNKPLTSGLRRNGESLVITFNATPTACEAGAAAWTVRADGILLVFALQGSQPTTTITDACGGTGGGALLNSSTNPDADPGVAFALDILEAYANLPSGANGPVTLRSNTCADDECGLGPVVVTLEGSFKDGEGEPLYGPVEPGPASVYLSCGIEYVEGEEEDYFEIPCSDLPQVEYDDGSEEHETFAPEVYVAGFAGEGYDPFVLPPLCGNWNGEGYNFGALWTAAAQEAQFCLDIGNPDAYDPETNELTSLPILFFEDPKFIVGR